MGYFYFKMLWGNDLFYNDLDDLLKYYSMEKEYEAFLKEI